MTEKRKYSAKEIACVVLLIALCAAMAVLDFAKIPYVKDERRNGLISDTVPLLAGITAVVWLMLRGKSKLFGRPQKLLFLLPALLVAVDNFPFWSYFSGKGELTATLPIDFLLFALYCACVGVFEECVFRGILFPVLAGCFSPDQKGLVKTFFLSSVIFGGMHVFNIFVGAGVGPTLLQVGYTTLTGGLFAFVLIKTKNILLCALTHGVYNFCGLLLPRLGNGTIFDLGTTVTMAIVGVSVGLFVLYHLWKYPESERAELYQKLGFGVRPFPQKTNRNEGKEQE